MMPERHLVCCMTGRCVHPCWLRQQDGRTLPTCAPGPNTIQLNHMCDVQHIACARRRLAPTRRENASLTTLDGAQARDGPVLLQAKPHAQRLAAERSDEPINQLGQRCSRASLFQPAAEQQARHPSQASRCTSGAPNTKQALALDPATRAARAAATLAAALNPRCTRSSNHPHGWPLAAPTPGPTWPRRPPNPTAERWAAAGHAAGAA
jgi:hypothetical protein